MYAERKPEPDSGAAEALPDSKHGHLQADLLRVWGVEPPQGEPELDNFSGE